ncbi:MAG: type IV secretion protein IcmJ [Gammaproteobacteria bacterium RIFCSPHIGHO2_12_FULL_41_15]|nr:MAG: type IV secretion protein IcmJ [Gammaproteobacteria bacterium RIFCSPHIGHO2_12_FULL_41_15]
MEESVAQSTLELKASLGAWRMYSARKIDPKFEAYQRKVLQRDRYRCQYCGFQAMQYQDVINQDGDFSNNKMTNLVTACCFCAQCFFVESVGVGGYGGGTLIYLPEMSQQQLNSLCHVLFCAITNNTGYKSTAQAVYRVMKQRSKFIEDKFGEGTSDPSVLGQLIIDSGANNSEMKKVFTNVCLLPSRGKFRVQIERWAASALEAATK